MENTGAQNCGLELRTANEADSSTFKSFYAAERRRRGGLRPVLHVTYTHEPNEAALGMSTRIGPTVLI